MIFRDCSEALLSQESIEGYPLRCIPLAVYVPMNPDEMVPEGAFAGVPRMRHASVEPGIRLVGAEAWQSCRQLRIVRLPETVVSIADNAFRGCRLLNSITAPGCRGFGYKSFADCHSLQWVYTTEGTANKFDSNTKFGHYLFRDCINLADFTLQEHPTERGPASQTVPRTVAPGCLSGTGITKLMLPQSILELGAHACENCRLLKQVDLTHTEIEEIQSFTFAHCTSLQEVSLPTTVTTIRVKSFMNCANLKGLAIPPSLKYIASRAFLDCTEFQRMVKLPGRHKWRGIYAEENAFAICPKMRWPPWLRMIPDTGYASGVA